MFHITSDVVGPLNILLFIVGLLLVFRQGILKRIGLFCLFVSLGFSLYFIVSPYLLSL